MNKIPVKIFILTLAFAGLLGIKEATAINGDISINEGVLTVATSSSTGGAISIWLVATTTFIGLPYDQSTFNTLYDSPNTTQGSCTAGQCPIVIDFSTETNFPIYVAVNYNMGGGYFDPAVASDIFYIDSNFVIQEQFSDTSTHFIELYPTPLATTSTTTTTGARIYVNSNDIQNYGRLKITFTQDSAFACGNSGALFDAIYTCSGQYIPRDPITVTFDGILERLLTGGYTLSTTTTFSGGGRWNAYYEIQEVSQPWYLFGLHTFYSTIVSTTTYIIIGTSSPMDITIADLREKDLTRITNERTALGSLASTTARLKEVCSPIATSTSFIGIEYNADFDITGCVFLFVYSEESMSDNLLLLERMPPWGYVFRIYDIFTATSSTTTLPTISYTFSSTSPLAEVGEIHFDPFGIMLESGELINEMKSDRDEPQTVWQILMPIVNVFVWLVFAFMVVHDLTGIHSHDEVRGNKPK